MTDITVYGKILYYYLYLNCNISLFYVFRKKLNFIRSQNVFYIDASSFLNLFEGKLMKNLVLGFLKLCINHRYFLNFQLQNSKFKNNFYDFDKFRKTFEL
jgi:hypothetical protein